MFYLYFLFLFKLLLNYFILFFWLIFYFFISFFFFCIFFIWKEIKDTRKCLSILQIHMFLVRFCAVATLLILTSFRAAILLVGYWHWLLDALRWMWCTIHSSRSLSSGVPVTSSRRQLLQTLVKEWVALRSSMNSSIIVNSYRPPHFKWASD